MAEQQIRAPSGSPPTSTDLPGYATRGKDAEKFTRSLAKLLERSVRSQRDAAKPS